MKEDLIWEAHSVQFSPCGKYLLVRTPSGTSALHRGIGRELGLR